MPDNTTGNQIPSTFYDPVEASDLSAIQANLKKNQQIQRRYLISVAYLPDTILSPVTLAEILVQQSNNMKLNPAEPGYANKILLMREKARNLVFLAAIRKASAVVNMKEALGTKGAIQLNSATRLAIKLAQPSLLTVDNYFKVNFDEVIPSDEQFHISPHISMTLHEDIPDTDLNVHGSFNVVVQELVVEHFSNMDMESDTGKAKALRIQRAEFEREVFVISRLLSSTENNTIRPRLVLNISRAEADDYITVTPDHDSYAKFAKSVKNDLTIENICHLAEHKVTSNNTNTPEYGTPEFEEWKVRTITLADVAFIAKNGILKTLKQINFVNIEVFGIAPFVEDKEVQFADVAVCFSDTSLYRYLTPGAALTVRDMYDNPNFSDERLETCIKLFGDVYNYNVITHNDIAHYKKGNNFLPESARSLINRITASKKLNVAFINAQDALIKADANGDTLNTMEIGDQDQIERALMLHNEKNDFSLEYISVFANLINKHGQPSQDHVADTSIPSSIATALRNDEMALATLKTKTDIVKEVSIIMENVMRNDKGMTMTTPNLTAGQFKADDGRIKFSVVGDYTKVGVEVTERINQDQIELIISRANYLEGEDAFDVIDSFVNHPVKVMDHNLMNEITFDFNFDVNSLPTSYNEFIHGISYAPNFNETLNSAIPISQLVVGANIGTLPNADFYAVRSGSHTLTIMPGANVNLNDIEVTFNRYKLYESNGEVETLYFNHVSAQHKKRIAIVLNQFTAKKSIRIKKLQDEYKVSLKVKPNYKLQDFMKLKYVKSYDTNNLLMNDSYSLAGLDYKTRVALAQAYSNISITAEYYKHLKEYAMKIVMDLSTLQSFFRLFTNLEVYEYSRNDMLAGHITLYKAKFVALSDKETLIVHDIVFATITAIIKRYDTNVLPSLEALSEKKIDGTISDTERKRYARKISEHPVACWTSKITRAYSVPDQIRNIYREIVEGVDNV